ncbi:MAG TPA: tetratricopeptide repeat protein [Vicinamibacterales bacterium]|jgi:hypothetical protein|nr:tetratricopeptide repeat protein [Vicinamibacterales bacterium]
MPDIPEEALERLLAGTMPAADQRRLAQASLSDPDLFDSLTAAGVAVNALTPAAEPAQSPAIVRAPEAGAPARLAIARPGTGRFRIAALAGLAAAAVIAAAVMLRSGSPAPGAGTTASSKPASSAPLTPPLLLVARAEPTAGPAFRSDAASSRLPRASGTVVSVVDGTANVDLGSLDGLTQGTELRAWRGQPAPREIGRVRVSAVFRDHARGPIAGGGPLQAGDRVDVDPRVYAAALLEQAAARRAAGDTTAARKIAELAVAATRPGEVPADVRRGALGLLGAVHHESRDLDEAARYLSEAVETFDRPPAAPPAVRAGILNELGAVRIEQQDYAAAGRALDSARGDAEGAVKVRVTNNLGALAAIRGDRAAAERLYNEARSLAAGAADLGREQQAIEKNLQALPPAR